MFSEQEFQPELQHFYEATPSIDFNLANSSEYVPEVERNNRALQILTKKTMRTLTNKRLILKQIIKFQ